MPTITFKASHQETQRIRLAARTRRMTVSQYVRAMSLPKSGAKASCANDIKPGRVVIAPAANAPLLTEEMVKSALYDL
ncbi:MAG: hypothetical protein LBM04_10885 [Opitutaceae bacterium]|nr:hypothetical protein [Opitutaceae bacterium]